MEFLNKCTKFISLISGTHLIVQILCEVGDITAVGNGEVPLHPADGRAAADEHEKYGEILRDCSPSRTQDHSRRGHGLS